MQRPLPPPGSRAIVLGRFSSDLQNPSSADDQIRQGVEFCERHGWLVVGKEKDEARTGRTTVGRTGYYNVMAAAEAGECDVVVLEDVSRMARDAADMLISARKLSESNVVICTLGGGVLSGLELAIRAQMAQEQSEDTARRVKRGHRSAALKGKAMGGIAYGYKLLDVPDEHGGNRGIEPEKAKVVVRIYEDLFAGVSTLAICASLNREGVAPPSGKIWRPKSITGSRDLMGGIGRNPLYVGKLIYGKTNSKLVASTGQTKVTPGSSAEHIITDVPHLQIVPEALWHAVQEILDTRSNPIPNRTRHPRYLFSGLIKCGLCGNSFSMVSRDLGCEGHRHGSGCSNRRRVSRQDLQDTVLTGLTEKILQPNILALYLDEYRVELEKATAEMADRANSSEARLKDVDREIDNTLSVIKAGVSTGQTVQPLAAQMLYAELDRLGAQKKQLERQVRASPSLPTLSLEPDAIIDRLKILLAHLASALEGPERDAARARDIIRSFVKKISVVPVEADGKPDGRCIGPVRITVEGSLTDLLSQASPDRQIKRHGSTFTTLNLPTVGFWYDVEIADKLPNTSPTLYADTASFSRLLDDAEAPVARRDIVAALNDLGRDPADAEYARFGRRADNAINRLLQGGLIRSVMAGFQYTGWVWNDRPISDEEWVSRARLPKRPGHPIGILRVQAPSAYVVVVAPNR